MPSGGLFTSSGKSGGVATAPFVADGAMMGSLPVAGREFVCRRRVLLRRSFDMKQRWS